MRGASLGHRFASWKENRFMPGTIVLFGAPQPRRDQGIGLNTPLRLLSMVEASQPVEGAAMPKFVIALSSAVTAILGSASVSFATDLIEEVRRGTERFQDVA